ncbi:MAG: hypothetical protein QOJ36_575 [Verrucomicrobiota bacterium]
MVAGCHRSGGIHDPPELHPTQNLVPHVESWRGGRVPRSVAVEKCATGRAELKLHYRSASGRPFGSFEDVSAGIPRFKCAKRNRNDGGDGSKWPTDGGAGHWGAILRSVPWSHIFDIFHKAVSVRGTKGKTSMAENT